MKLRNKKTGKIQTCDMVVISDERIDGEIARLNRHTFIFRNIEQFNDNYEGYNSAEPLIKDEKIRKAVRAWAKANGVGGCICKEEIHCITFETERGMFISFENADPIPPEGNYTIAELCGEGEE